MFPLQKDIWTEVIGLYKNMPFLWDKSDQKYSCRQTRDIGYNIILKKYREHDKNASMASLKKKLDNMRTSYRRELKKVLSSKHNSSSPDGVYVPELWYFDSLSFLREHIVMQHKRYSSDDEDNENSQTSEQCSYTDDSINLGDTSMEHFFFSNTDIPTKRKKIKRETHIDSIEDPHSLVTTKEDDWLVVGKSIGVQLKNLDGHQSTIAQKIIAETLFYAKLGKLNEYSTISLNEVHEDLSDGF